MPLPPAERRVQDATESLKDFLDTELAASKIEAEAKLIEAHHGQNTPFEPAHLHDARVRLEQQGFLHITRKPTRGGSQPPIWEVTDTRKRSRKVEETAGRKRMLMARYYAYAQGTPSTGTGLTGDAGEIAFHAALQRASVGASLADLSRGVPNLRHLDGVEVDLDNAFALLPMTPDRQSFRAPPFKVIVEVKNIREWVYPRSHELFQVLRKGALLQRANPSTDYLPLLVCRRVHKTTLFMAKRMGFFVIDTRKHYFPVHSQIPRTDLEDLIQELALIDITQSTGPEVTARTENRLVTLQQHADTSLALARWKAHCKHPEFLPLLVTLEDEKTHWQDRAHALDRLRNLCRRVTGEDPGW